MVLWRRFRLPAFRSRVFAVKLLLLDHGEVVKCLGLDEELTTRGITKGESLADEIKRQTAILDEYEEQYREVCACDEDDSIVCTVSTLSSCEFRAGTVCR